ncbi:hypothetical protein A1O7_03608 [Cladophialophora yegresii CBS 114405]|uniref:C2H2-type domain-containing protein n=1 Tax=Cladophialophora yegresii CBS 114405 TaxID=1182544 RepID=W9W5C7_9EURO|nr:uncharacterized protein A1O7_03608 [Cladophialophora yegresii CBS 114405]EXJ63163.1 hypothetical protein A1O7_03608 [Cladophialophora yegresii CBS 114405]
MVKRSRESSILSIESDEQSPVTPSSESHPPAKVAAAMVDAPAAKAVMLCSLPPHRDTLDFASIEDFEIHYVKDHSNRCTSCSKNFPTAHFLALHIDENHNPIREALQAKGEKTYGCFVEGCDKKCSTPQKRRLHLIDKHLFPKMYNFRIVDTGVDQSTSMLREDRRRRVSTTADRTASSGTRRRQSQAGKQQISAAVLPDDKRLNFHPEQNVSDAAIRDLETSMSALRFVPPQIRQQNTRNPT